MVVAHVVLPAGLEESVGAHHIGLHEGLGVRDGVVVVGLRRVVHDSIMAGHQAVEKVRVADVTHHELYLGLRKPCDVGGVTGVGELVEHRHVDPGVLPRHPAHEVGPDEATTASDDDVMRLEGVRHGVSLAGE